MKGKKTSSEKIVAVVTAKIANPDLSSRDIEEQVWDVDHSTVTRILDKDLQHLATSSDKAFNLFEANLEIIAEATKKVSIAMKNMNPEKITEAKEMQSIVDTAFKQNQLLTWGKTENIGVSVLSQAEQDNLL